MRLSLLFAPLVLIAAPAAAQSELPEIEVPGELTDPATMDRLTAMMEALSKAFLSLPVGEVQAAAEGREPTAADRRRTVRSETGMSETELKARMAEARPAMEAGMKALASALPAMMKALSEVGDELEKSTANLPQPGYPKR